jgi:hypothetical protein
VRLRSIIHLLLFAFIAYQMVAAVWAIVMMMALLLNLVFTVLQQIPTKYSRAYGVVRLASPFGAPPAVVYRRIVMSADPAIGDDEKAWASRQLEKLGKPIIYIPPKVVRRPTLVD